MTGMQNWDRSDYEALALRVVRLADDQKIGIPALIQRFGFNRKQIQRLVTLGRQLRVKSQQPVG